MKESILERSLTNASNVANVLTKEEILQNMKESILERATEQHRYSTRSASSDLVVIESFRTNVRRFCSSVIGRYFWYDILLEIRYKPCKNLFKNALKHYYVAQY